MGIQKPKTEKMAAPLLWAAGTLAVVVVLALALWLACVRPQLTKGRSDTISDDFGASVILHDGDTAEQVFAYDYDLLAVGVEFYLPGGQPVGTLEVALYDADTGEALARSTGELQYIVPDQYTVLGLDTPVTGAAGRRYRLCITPHYTTDAVAALGHSKGAALWKENLTVNGEAVDGTLALIVTRQRIGGYLTRFFLIVAGLAGVLAAFAVWAARSRKIALHRAVFVLVLGFGLLYSVVLPPYAAPDEKYHINQSFTLAAKWANRLSDGDWVMGTVPTDTTFRRSTDVDETLQDENTTVFTWQEFTDTLFTTTDAAFDDAQEYRELQTDQNPLLYLASGAAVFLAYLLHWGFTPALALGRLANLLLFAALAAWAVRIAPCGKRAFAAAALLPMTLHLAASFSRDAPLLGLCFVFTALALDAVCGPNPDAPLPAARRAALAVTGVLLAPGKLVYLPLAALFVLLPRVRLGRHAKAKKVGYLAVCLALALTLNSGLLTGLTAAAQTDTATEAATGTTAEAAAAAAAGARETRGKQPEDPAAYEAQIAENTAENYVRRLYYYVEGNAAPAQSEVDFWANALQQGDVNAMTLGQVFYFTAERINGYDDARAFFATAAPVLLGRSLNEDELAAFLPAFDEGGALNAYKMLFGVTECQTRFAALGLETGAMDDRLPLERATLAAEIEAAQTTRASQSVAAEADKTTYTVGYILRHPADTALLLVRSAVQNTDHYLGTLVGGSLSYYTLDLAWGWVLALYALLVYAALPARDAPLPGGRARLWGGLAAAACALLAVAGCLLWTPTYYETLYGLQGRYFLPVLPLALLTLAPRRLAAVPDEDGAAARLIAGLGLVQAGVILNIMLAIIAR